MLEQLSATLFQLYQAFAGREETASMRAKFSAGISWREVKQAVFERIDTELAPMRRRYEELVTEAAEIEQRLQEEAVRARSVTVPLLVKLREAVGVGRLLSITSA